MEISENLKSKVIIVADTDPKLVVDIVSSLKKEGYFNIKIAKDGKKVYDHLRPYYEEPEEVGLIIIGENLPLCNVNEMCITMSNFEGGILVPFIILQSDENNVDTSGLRNNNSYTKGVIHSIKCPLDFSAFPLVVGFQLLMNYERFLRYKQEDRLINELAERKVVDARLKYLVVHDELTSLLNRQNFERRLRLVLKRNNRLHQNGGLLFIDVDLFSLINELEGFDVGDRLLVEIVAIINKLTNKGDLFSRIGSDEFCLFLDNRSAAEIVRFAEKIRKDIYEARLFIGDACYCTSVSIGISGQNTRKAVYHPGEMISRARQACIIAKESGRNMIKEYNEEHARVQERDRDIYWVPLIRNALVEGKLFLVYQPIVNLVNGDISHYEALIRMRGLDNEIISPIDFIPVAERIGLIHRIDLWVIEQAIDFLAALPPKMSQTSLAINLSSVAFQDSSLLPTIKEKLELSWVDADRITFEITETVAVDKVEQTRELITKIRALGCKFALDDFGAGFCSFNYLKSFPVDYIKIDGQFIRNLVNDDTDQVLVKSMVEVAKKLGKKTIAEYVETPGAIHKLREIGIDFGQGYLFGKPQMKLLSKTKISLTGLIKREGKTKNNHPKIDTDKKTFIR
ncbi:MAG: EAL domain-containing protein [Methylococcaceae bacterium]|nr:EAL domain-containing protein [Methylococcaceae bacterium]